MKYEERSWTKKSSKPEWVLNSAVGRTAVSMPMALRIGRATVMEHFPLHEISWIVTAFFTL